MTEELIDREQVRQERRRHRKTKRELEQEIIRLADQCTEALRRQRTIDRARLHTIAQQYEARIKLLLASLLS